MAAISHREVGADLPDYATGMSQAIRLGADLIAVGDVPDVESARKLLDAAERRVPVIASVGAPSAEEATWWLLRMFFGQERDDTERRIQTVLRSVIASSPQSKAQVIVSKKKAPRLSAVGT
jgi:Tfp pilus assembly pilus retraction ATPase PilT